MLSSFARNQFIFRFVLLGTKKLLCERFYYSAVHVSKFKLTALTYLLSDQTSFIMPNILVDYLLIYYFPFSVCENVYEVWLLS